MSGNGKSETSEPRELALSRLHEGMPGMTPELGAALAQAAAVCLENQDHAPGVVLRVAGTHPCSIAVHWTAVSEQAVRSWGDLQDATEDAAYGIAALLVDALTEYTIFERSWKGTGFDYWLARKGSDGTLFQSRARLEVSGILQGSERDVMKRLEKKMIQADRSHVSLAKIVVIVEFGCPSSHLEQR